VIDKESGIAVEADGSGGGSGLVRMRWLAGTEQPPGLAGSPGSA